MKTSIHLGGPTAKSDDITDDEPTTITAFDAKGVPHDGKLLAASDQGSLVAFQHLGVIAFDSEGFAEGGLLVLCPESLPEPRCAEDPS